MAGFWGCKWCGGSGCVCCKDEADRKYKEQFPDGPKPLITFKRNDPQDMELMRESIGGKALQQAFSPAGGGMSEVLANIEKALQSQKTRRDV